MAALLKIYGTYLIQAIVSCVFVYGIIITFDKLLFPNISFEKQLLKKNAAIGLVVSAIIIGSFLFFAIIVGG